MRSATSDSWTAIKAENSLADERGRRLTRVEWSNVVVMKTSRQKTMRPSLCVSQETFKSQFSAAVGATVV